MRFRPPASLRLRLPPALRAAAPLPAAPPPPPRRAAPSPLRPCAGLRTAGCATPTGGSLLPRTRRSLRQLNPSPAAPPGRPGPRVGAAPLAAPRVGERRPRRPGRGGGTETKSPSLNPRRPSAPRPAWVSGGGSREGQEADCGGEGAPRPAPSPGSCFRDKPFPRG